MAPITVAIDCLKITLNTPLSKPFYIATFATNPVFKPVFAVSPATLAVSVAVIFKTWGGITIIVETLYSQF